MVGQIGLFNLVIATNLGKKNLWIQTSVHCLGIDVVTEGLSKYILDTKFTNPSAQAGYDTRSIFKQSLTGFEFRVFLLLD